MSSRRWSLTAQFVALCVAWSPALAEDDGGPSSGVNLLGHLALEDFPNSPLEANDVWGYVSASGREYALVGMYDQTAIVDVTDPETPVVVHTRSRSGSNWSDMAVYGDYALLVADGTGDGLVVLDLSDLDNGNVEFVRAYHGPLDDRFFLAHNVKVNGDFAYLIGTTPGNAVRIIDISDPANPSQVKRWSGAGTHDAYIKTYDTGPYAGREIAFIAAENSGVFILDVTDKESIQALATNVMYPNLRYCHQLWPTEDDRYLFVNDELDEVQDPDVNETTTHVFNIEDLETPLYLGSFTSGLGATDHNLMVRGSYVYEANYHSGLRVFSIANIDAGIDQIREVAYYDTYPGDDSAGFNGAWGVYTALPSGNVLVSDIESGLFVFDVIAAVEPEYARFDDAIVSEAAATDGVSWVTDGDSDGLYVPTRDGTSRLLVSDAGTGEFAVAPDSDFTLTGDRRSGLWFDADGDGDLDAYLTASGGANSLLRNDGGGAYTDITVAPLGEMGDARGVAAADYDGDGDLDLYLSNQGSANRLFRNDGDNMWVETAAELGVVAANASVGVAWGDYDADGDPDLVVSSLSGANSLFRNDSGLFTEITLTGIPWRSQTMGLAWGDVDGDLDLDLFVANLDRQDALYRNDGADTFVDVTDEWNLPAEIMQSVGTTWADYDRDGFLDLFVTQLDGGLRLFDNDGTSFVDVSHLNFGSALGLEATGVATADYDRDGDLDVYVGNVNGENRLYTNRGANRGTWLRVDLLGPDHNRFGIGARVEVYDGATWQVREIAAGTGYLSQEPASAFFGLPGGAADSIHVRWPDGSVTDSVSVSGNRQITVIAPGATPTDDDPYTPPDLSVAGFELYPNAPNPFNPTTRITYDLGDRATVWLTVHDVGGRRVRVLIAGVAQSAGQWVASWDGTDDAGRPVASGVYRYRIRAGAYNESRTMTLLK